MITPQLTAPDLARRLTRRVRRLRRAAGRLPHAPTDLIRTVHHRAGSNRDFVRRVSERRPQPDHWRDFADRIVVAWKRTGRRSLLVRVGVRSWRSLPGVDTGQAIEVGLESLRTGELAWAELIADAILALQPGHRRANQLKARVHAARQEWRPAQDRWMTALGGPRRRTAARRWVINEQGRSTARRMIGLMPDPESITDGRGGSLADAAAVPVDRAEEFGDQLGGVLLHQVLHGDSAAVRPLLDAWSAGRQRERLVLAPVQVARSVRLMNLHRFRSYLAGRSVALVANSPALLGSGLGPVIDGYDIVLRFNSFALVPGDTGRRTDVHVAFHKYDYNLSVPVDVRILLSAREDLWRESMKLRVRPGAQRWLGDSSLRWPAVSLGLIGPDEEFRLPTAGFNLLRLLLHLDVSSRIDLIGFDFYRSGMHRLAGAARIPHSPGHRSAAEQDWVMAHAVTVGDKIISMKGAD